MVRFLPRYRFSASLFPLNVQREQLLQNKADRFILGNYHRTARVTPMTIDLSLSSLAERCKSARLSLFHRIYTHNPVLKQEQLHPPSYITSRHDPNHRAGIPFCHTNTCLTTFIPKTLLKRNRLPYLLITGASHIVRTYCICFLF